MSWVSWAMRLVLFVVLVWNCLYVISISEAPWSWTSIMGCIGVLASIELVLGHTREFLRQRSNPS